MSPNEHATLRRFAERQEVLISFATDLAAEFAKLRAELKWITDIAPEPEANMPKVLGE